MVPEGIPAVVFWPADDASPQRVEIYICPAAKRKAAYHEIVQNDEDIEKHFRDVTISNEPASDVFMRFLAAVQFSNGFDTMKWLNIGNRIKWMKICALLWHSKGRKINVFRFDIDDQKTGLDLDIRLQALAELQLNRYLAQIDGDASLESLPYISITNQYVSALGFTFCSQEDKGILSIIF